MAKVNAHVAWGQIIEEAGSVLDFSLDFENMFLDALMVLGDLDADFGHSDWHSGFFYNVFEVMRVVWCDEDELRLTEDAELLFGDLETF
jgi:hypothetical protein